MKKGDMYGHLMVLAEAPGKNGERMVYAHCTRCSAMAKVHRRRLLAGRVKSCGCLRHGNAKKTHGMSDTREYRIWSGILARVDRPSTPMYAYYGGRGVRIADEWRSFEAFISDMGPCPSEDHSIDRIDSEGHYEPGNCRWATRRQQGNNRRNRLTVETEHGPVSLHCYLSDLGVQDIYSTVLYRLRAWEGDPPYSSIAVDNAIECPLKRGKGGATRQRDEIDEAAEQAGVTRTTILARMRQQGITPQEASYPSLNKTPPPGNRRRRRTGLTPMFS